MLLLDENLPADQHRLLRKWRIRFRIIGVDEAESGLDDENLLPLLHRLPRPTFFTLDRDFYRLDWAHPNHCLAWLDVPSSDSAEYIRRFLRLPTFDTQAKRMGVVARIYVGGVVRWQAKRSASQSLRWPVA